MESILPEDYRVARFLASFGDKTPSTFGHTIASVQRSASEVTWELATARLLQEYEELIQYDTKRSTPVKRIKSSSHALTAQRQYGSVHPTQGGQKFHIKDNQR